MNIYKRKDEKCRWEREKKTERETECEINSGEKRKRNLPNMEEEDTKKRKQ